MMPGGVTDVAGERDARPLDGGLAAAVMCETVAHVGHAPSLCARQPALRCRFVEFCCDTYRSMLLLVSGMASTTSSTNFSPADRLERSGLCGKVLGCLGNSIGPASDRQNQLAKLCFGQGYLWRLVK